MSIQFLGLQIEQKHFHLELWFLILSALDPKEVTEDKGTFIISMLKLNKKITPNENC